MNKSRISELNLSKILSSIREEMNEHLIKTPSEEKLLRNYIFGRIATLDDIEKRIQ